MLPCPQFKWVLQICWTNYPASVGRCLEHLPAHLSRRLKMKCTKCSVDKPLTEEFFYKHKSTKTGFHTQCIECVKEIQRELRKDPEKGEIARLRASKHWHAKPQEERSKICNERRLSQRFKRTPEWYDETLETQSGHCAICSVEPGKRRFHVDHNHACCPCVGTRYTCGKCVRGLLCDACNTSLGYLERLMADLKNPEVGEVDLRNSLRPDSWTYKALKYLKNYSG